MAQAGQRIARGDVFGQATILVLLPRGRFVAGDIAEDRPAVSKQEIGQIRIIGVP